MAEVPNNVTTPQGVLEQLVRDINDNSRDYVIVQTTRYGLVGARGDESVHSHTSYRVVNRAIGKDVEIATIFVNPTGNVTSVIVGKDVAFRDVPRFLRKLA